MSVIVGAHDTPTDANERGDRNLSKESHLSLFTYECYFHKCISNVSFSIFHALHISTLVISSQKTKSLLKV